MTPLVIRMTIIIDATTWSFTYNCHSDIFILQATGAPFQGKLLTFPKIIDQARKAFSVAHLQDRLLALPANISLGQKGLAETNTLACLTHL